MIDVCARFGLGVRKYSLYYICRHFFQQVSRIVSHHVIDDVGCFLIGQGGDNVLLVIDLQVREDVCCHVLGKNTEDPQGILILHLVHDRGNIGCIHFRECFPEFFVFFLGEELAEILLIYFFDFFHNGPPLHKMRYS